MPMNDAERKRRRYLARSADFFMELERNGWDGEDLDHRHMSDEEARAHVCASVDCECQHRSDDASVERLGGEGGTTPCGHCENGIQEQAGTGALRVCPKCGGRGTDGEA